MTPEEQTLDALVRDLDAANDYIDAAGAHERSRTGGNSNVIDTRYACKFDLISRRDRAFSREVE